VSGQPGVTHVLLDFFGTLVNYSPSRTGQGYHDSHDLIRAMGADISYAGFLQAWTAESASFDARSASDDSEFSMTELACAFLAGLLGRAPDPAGITAFVSCYLREWNSGVTYPQGMAGVVADLAQHCRLAIVTNTHQPDLVPAHLDAMGIAHYFDEVVTSVEVGWRKPHPVIYAEALRRLGIPAVAAVFAGDTYTADYVGPAAAGMTAFLIDPANKHGVPAGSRLRDLSDLPERLGQPPRTSKGPPAS
jgi:putative hydrolase of the HAD superfamily